MEESTALWLLGLAHSEYEAARSELDEADGWRKAMALDLDAARKEVDALRVERMTLRDERDAARAEAETLRAERDALKATPSTQEKLRMQVAIGDLTAERDALRDALQDVTARAQIEHAATVSLAAERDALRAERDALKSAARGWFRVGDWAFAALDGRIVREINPGDWAAESASGTKYSGDAIEAARAAGWHDFPGVSDHSAGAP